MLSSIRKTKLIHGKEKMGFENKLTFHGKRIFEEEDRKTFQNRMYRDTASIAADRSSSGWADQISIAGTADCRYYIFVCTKVWKINEN